jgi:serine/threonine-protein kinase
VGSDTELTEAGRWIGTVDYCSPEQLQGERTDARSDVYALGCVLFTALTGHTPFGRGTVPSTMMAHLHDEAPRISAYGAPREFDRVIHRALAKDPEDRYPSAGDLGRAALAAARGELVTESERSVARGMAAPETAAPTTNGHDEPTRALGETAATRAIGAPGATAATRFLAEPEPKGTAVAPEPEPPASDEAVHMHRRLRQRPPFVIAAGVLALAAVGVVLGLLLGDPGPSSAARTGPLSRNEVRSAAQAFASAYGDEDANALRRTLSRDVLRVLPSGVARGRETVVAQYNRQFDGKVQGYHLSGLGVTGGTAGRAEGDYRVDRQGEPAIQGHIVFGVIRERGVPRIRLIAATPKS